MTLEALATRTGVAVGFTVALQLAIHAVFYVRALWMRSPLSLRLARIGQVVRERLGLRPTTDIYVGETRLEPAGLSLWVKLVIGLGGAVALFVVLWASRGFR